MFLFGKVIYQKPPNPLPVLLAEALKDFGARVCRGRLCFPKDPAPPCRWRSCFAESSWGWPRSFGVQLRNDSRTKPKENFLGRSRWQKNMKSRELIRTHLSGYLRSEGLKKRKSTSFFICRLRLLDIMWFEFRFERQGWREGNFKTTVAEQGSKSGQ